jgi:hypothetical protein
MRVKDFFSWQNESIFENVQAAKDFMLKMQADVAKKSVSDLKPEEKERALKHPNFEQIKKMLMKNPGWTLAFTRFHFLEGASMEQLKELFDELMAKRQILNKLPQPVESYSKPESDDIDSDGDKRPGYERLSDDLIILDRKQKLKKFYNEMNSAQKKMFDTASIDQISKMTEIANQFDSKDPEAFKEFVKYISRYKDLDTLISAAEEFVSQYGKGFDELFLTIKELGPQVGVLYNKNGYFIFSTRSQDAIKKLCGDASWCIVSSSNYFWNYSEGRVQMNAYNFNLPVTDPLSLIGITVNKDGTVHATYDRTNSSISSMGNTYQQILKKAGYPDDAIEQVEKNFQNEVNIKMVLEKFFKESQGWDDRKVISNLISVTRGVASGIISQSDWDQIADAVSSIILNSKDISVDSLLGAFTKNGIYSESGWKVFDTLIGDKYTKQQMEDIMKSTESGLEVLQTIINRNREGTLQNKSQDLQNYSEIIGNKDWIYQQIKDRLK